MTSTIAVMFMLAALLERPWQDFLLYLLLPFVIVAVLGISLTVRRARRVVAIALCALWVCVCTACFLILAINRGFGNDLPNPLGVVPVWLAIGLAMVWGTYVAAGNDDRARR